MKQQTEKQTKKENIPYKEMIAELEQILQKLENQELDMDDLENKVKRAVQLIEMCKERLFNTGESIDKILG
jgi:exodeoxyribonuclease VII small subunit